MGIGAALTAVAVGFAAMREIERKDVQSREDPQTFRRTPLYITGGVFVGLIGAGLVRAQRRARVEG